MSNQILEHFHKFDFLNLPQVIDAVERVQNEGWGYTLNLNIDNKRLRLVRAKTPKTVFIYEGIHKIATITGSR